MSFTSSDGIGNQLRKWKWNRKQDAFWVLGQEKKRGGGVRHILFIGNRLSKPTMPNQSYYFLKIGWNLRPFNACPFSLRSSRIFFTIFLSFGGLKLFTCTLFSRHVGDIYLDAKGQSLATTSYSENRWQTV